MSDDRTERERRIRNAVRRIPPGQVASYGDVGRLAGYPRAAREVGRVLRILPEGTDVPWHRVVNARGELRLAADSAAGREQRDRLRAEGVRIERGRVRLDAHRLRVDADLLIWGAPPR